ncbi:hypothetical protein [Candidatus Viridilinea mediisalina]
MREARMREARMREARMREARMRGLRVPASPRPRLLASSWAYA